MKHKASSREGSARRSVARNNRTQARNKAVIARYYYWTEIRRRRFDDVMRILSSGEFFIEDRTICNILSVMSDYLSELYERKTDGRALEGEYPSWNWHTPA
jgi:hypothetical protein